MASTLEKNGRGFFRNFKGDLFGGITAGIVALPLALAFGLSSGMGPDAGLYGAIFVAFFAALFGGTPSQISGPTAPMTAVSMIVIAAILSDFNGNLQEAIPAILTIFLLAGLVLVVLGFTGIGSYIKYIPYPVVSGFMTAIGVIILITQVLPMMGYYPNEDQILIDKYKPLAEEVLLDKILRDEAGEGIMVLEDFQETVRRAHLTTEEEIIDEAKILVSQNTSGVIGAIKSLGRAAVNINWIEFLLALLTIMIIYGFKRITSIIPSTLVALVIVTTGAYILKEQGMMSYRPIPQIPAGFPKLRFDIFSNFNFSSFSPYIMTAFSLAFLGAIDSLLTSVVADNLTKTRHDPNRELIGQGIGNSIAALFGGIPGAGATIRTVVNIHAGGKTKLSGMTAGILLLLILLALGPIASQIPAAVLAGILITVGFGVMDYKGLKSIPNSTATEVGIMILVIVLAVFWNLVYAVGIGLVIAALVFMKKMGDINTSSSVVIPLKDLDEIHWDDEMNFPEKFKEEVFIKHLDGPLFFGYTSDFQKLALSIPSTASHVVIRMDQVPFIDQSGLYAFEDVLLGLIDKNIDVLIVGLQEQPRLRLMSIRIIPELVTTEHLFKNFKDCLNFIVANVKDKY